MILILCLAAPASTLLVQRPIQPPGFTAGSAASVISSARVVTPPVNPFQSGGDLWVNTWADDGHLYAGWGDGTGPGGLDPQTDCGLCVLQGSVPYYELTALSPPDSIRSKFVPDGTQSRDDKPSSLLSLDGRLVLSGHTPLGDPDRGYLAYSADRGRSWFEIPNSPWTKVRSSVFRCLYFINMGRDYNLNQDGFVYAFGIGREWSWTSRQVYLCRVPRSQILSYPSYRYLAGLASGIPVWSGDESEAVPVEGLETHQQSSVLFHEGIERYLFLTNEALFEAPQPWGPWAKVASLLEAGNDPEWKRGYMPSLVAKDAGADFFYFHYAGQSSVIRYMLTTGRVEMELRSEVTARAEVDVTSGAAPLTVSFQGGGTALGASIVSYRWFFGDGQVSREQNPVHTYTQPAAGSFRAMLTVTDSLGRRGFDILDIIVPFCSLDLKPAALEEPVKPGLEVKYYSLQPGGGQAVPDFSIMTEYRRDVVSQVDFAYEGLVRDGGVEFATSGRKDYVAALFEGFVEAPADGIYSFYLVSDDASELWVDGALVVDNNGEHKQHFRERAGQVGLKAGRHGLCLGYTEIDQLNGLKLCWQGPGFGRELVPGDALSYAAKKKAKVGR